MSVVGWSVLSYIFSIGIHNMHIPFVVETSAHRSDRRSATYLIRRKSLLLPLRLWLALKRKWFVSKTGGHILNQIRRYNPIFDHNSPRILEPARFGTAPASEILHEAGSNEFKKWFWLWLRGFLKTAPAPRNLFKRTVPAPMISSNSGLLQFKLGLINSGSSSALTLRFDLAPTFCHLAPAPTF